MPLQNRVDPFGKLFRTPARGTMMGNRGGALHNSEREIVRSYKSRRWIACVLEFRGRRRVVMAERRYTELFFLDEAVAFAAGHRPCAECRRERFNAFKEAWRRAKKMDRLPFADEMDAELHTWRTSRGEESRVQATVGSLPEGCFVEVDGLAYLVRRDSLLLWTPEGYTRSISKPDNLRVRVLTPPPITQCLRHGYRPDIHGSGDIMAP